MIAVSRIETRSLIKVFKSLCAFALFHQGRSHGAVRFHYEGRIAESFSNRQQLFCDPLGRRHLSTELVKQDKQGEHIEQLRRRPLQSQQFLAKRMNLFHLSCYKTLEGHKRYAQKDRKSVV